MATLSGCIVVGRCRKFKVNSNLAPAQLHDRALRNHGWPYDKTKGVTLAARTDVSRCLFYRRHCELATWKDRDRDRNQDIFFGIGLRSVLSVLSIL